MAFSMMQLEEFASCQYLQLWNYPSLHPRSQTVILNESNMEGLKRR